MMLLGCKYTTSTIAVRERIGKTQRNVTIRILLPALSKEAQKQLIQFEEEERWHEQSISLRSSPCSSFVTEDF